jgi:DNA uptake protein ComE-like DNA-binding protein
MIAMLVVLAFLTVVLGAMSTGLLSEVKYVALQHQYVTVQYVAQSGFETACRELLNDETRFDALTDNWNGNTDLFSNIPVGEGVCEVSYPDELTGETRYGVSDEERKINVNLADANVLKRLSPAFTDEIVGALLKARSERPFATLDQMAALPGMPQGFLDQSRDEVAAGLRSVLTVYGDGRVNVNTAPAVVLAALPGVGPENARKIVELRATNGPLKSLGDVPAEIPLEKDLLKVSSEFFAIRAEGRLLQTNIVMTVRWFVQRNGDELALLGRERVL